MSDLMKLANHMARRYHERTYWRSNLQDLQQEAAIAALEAARTWRMNGAPLDKHAMMTIVVRLRRYLYAEGSPVTLGKGHEHEVSVESMPFDDISPWYGVQPGTVAETLAWREAVFTRIDEVLEKHDPSGVCARVMLQEQPCAKVAAELGVSTCQLGYRISEARKALREDGDLRELLGLCEVRKISYTRK